ncbi:MAG: PLDc_N domain-containing protein [Rhodothermales bacterium]|nr:PLDc_N domain-containing protein [Rhodothermales bacterium]
MQKWANTVSLASLSVLSLILTGCGGPNLINRFNNFWSYGICSTIVVVLDVVALIEVYGSERTTGDKLLWTFIIVVFPVFGCLMYYFFGRK